MADPHLEDLGRRAAACKAWWWMDGARDVTGRVVIHADGDGPRVWTDGEHIHDRALEPDCVWCGEIPDLSDPATIGCLLALVREAWKDPMVHLEAYKGWTVVFSDSRIMEFIAPYPSAPSEAEALVLALEGVPDVG